MPKLQAILWLVLVVAACGGAPTGSPRPTTVPLASADVPASPASVSPAASGDSSVPPAAAGGEGVCVDQLLHAEHDQLGRTLTPEERGRLMKIASATIGRQEMFLFTDGEHDFQCIYPASEFAPYGEIYAWSNHFPDGVTADAPLHVGPRGGGSDLPTYAWGAFGPPIVTIRVTRLDPATDPPANLDTVDALVAGPYFLGLFPEGACCLVRTIGLDADGTEVARSGG